VEIPAATVEAAQVNKDWEQLRDRWARVRDRIEQKIEDLDGRVRRKYENIPRYNYENVIKQLNADRALGEDATLALLGMNDLFLRLRTNPQRTRKEDLQEFERRFSAASRELP